MSFFKELIGYDLHTSKVVFDYDGVEIVFIQDFWIIKRRAYIDGELVFNRHSQCLGLFTDAEFDYQGRHFRIITRTLNYLTMKQDVTAWVNGIQAGRKVDRFYAGLSNLQRAHAVLGAMAFGFVVGLTASSLGSMLKKFIEAMGGG